MHLLRKHRHLKTVKCTTEGCQRTFYTIEMRDSHIEKDCRRRPNVFKKEDQTNFYCKFCGRFFDSYRKVRSHETNHRKKLKNAKEGARYLCDVCQKRFMSKEKLRMHIEAIHLKLLRLKCTECTVEFQSDSGYRHHMKMNHSDQETLKCDLCSYETRINFMLNRHKKRHLENRKHLFECGQCKATFKNQTNLLKHESRHAPLQCNICLSEFSTSFAIKEHMAQIHGTPMKKGILLCDMPKRQIDNDVLLLQESSTGCILDDFDEFFNFNMT